MKIIQYNVLDGCHEPTRLSLLKEWIQGQDADIIGFNELNYWTSDSFASFGQQLAFPYSCMFEEQRSQYRIGILSKSPIQYLGGLVEHFWHGLLHVRISGVHIMVTHMSPADSQSREIEAELIAARMKAVEDEPALLMGDLNTLSPHDQDIYTQMDLDKLLLSNEKLSLKFSSNGAVNYKPVQILLDSGLTDVGTGPNNFEHSVPTEINEDVMHAASLRLDYVLVNDLLLQQRPKASISYGRETDLISDHYPIICTWNRNI